MEKQLQEKINILLEDKSWSTYHLFWLLISNIYIFKICLFFLSMLPSFIL